MQFIKKIWKTYHVPRHIIEHMIGVGAVSYLIAEKINKTKSKNKVDVDLVTRAGLLHDIVKLVDFKVLDLSKMRSTYTKNDIIFYKKLLKQFPLIDHCEAGYLVLKKLKLVKIALIVRKHGSKALLSRKLQPKTLEEKIVHYADKRVKHETVVSIKHRTLDGHKRYSQNKKYQTKYDKVWPKLVALEKELCKKAKISPKSINAKSVEKYIKRIQVGLE